MTATAVDLPQRFWDKVDVRGPDECWEWQAARLPHGYGNFNFEGRVQRAHRLVLGLRQGDPGCALHRCDNPPCCNPGHLYIGTQLDNMQDRAANGTWVTPRGEKHGNTTLTKADVIEIREQYAAGGITLQRLADMYGISKAGVHRIIRRRTWGHVK